MNDQGLQYLLPKTDDPKINKQRLHCPTASSNFLEQIFPIFTRTVRIKFNKILLNLLLSIFCQQSTVTFGICLMFGKLFLNYCPYSTHSHSF